LKTPRVEVIATWYNSIVIPGGKLDLAMQLILTPMILQLIERSHRAS
jgi:phosphoribulokinase